MFTLYPFRSLSFLLVPFISFPTQLNYFTILFNSNSFPFLPVPKQSFKIREARRITDSRYELIVVKPSHNKLRGKTNRTMTNA